MGSQATSVSCAGPLAGSCRAEKSIQAANDLVKPEKISRGSSEIAKILFQLSFYG
jgi:hypothetical protein